MYFLQKNPLMGNMGSLGGIPSGLLREKGRLQTLLANIEDWLATHPYSDENSASWASIDNLKGRVISRLNAVNQRIAKYNSQQSARMPRPQTIAEQMMNQGISAQQESGSNTVAGSDGYLR